MGVRALHLFKDDWRAIHEFVSTTWELHETPVAYVRAGDGDQQGFADAGCKVDTHPFGYRSIHYVIKFQPDKCIRLVELQVRTIFEEGWSEIDHRVRYPRQSDDPQLAFFLTIFNRLAGSADEMGTFTKMLDAYLREQTSKAEESSRQIKEKETELRKTISQLQITKEEKLSLQKQIAEINKPSERVESGALLKSALLKSALQKLATSTHLETSSGHLVPNLFGSGFVAAASPFSLRRACHVWGKDIPFDASSANNLASLLTSPTCPECAGAGPASQTAAT